MDCQFYIRPIQESDWPTIISIQSQVYTTIEPESEDVLRSKQRLGQEFCLVITDNHHRLAGYCLAHPWTDQSIVLDHIYEPTITPALLYIHDLAILPMYKGKKLGSFVVEHLLHSAKKVQLPKAKIVSLAQARYFWEKIGFKEIQTPVDESYGKDAITMVRKIEG